MIGWAAATGTRAAERLLLSIIFLWTPPHFWALSLYTQATTPRPACRCCPWPRASRPPRQILIYSIMLVAISFAPIAIHMSGCLYGMIAAITGASFVYLAVRLALSRDTLGMKKVARALFTYSLSYLFVIFLALMTDHVGHLLGWVAA